MYYFQAIHIEFTPIRFINERAFRGLDEIQEFHIAASKINRVPSIVDISQSLVSLSITKSNIVSIPATYFSNCRQLTDFILTHSKLRSFPNLSDVKETLALLRLSNNHIRHVDLIYGVLFFQLRYLYLDHNWIHHFALEILNMPNLIHLNLTSNLITELAHPRVLALNPTSNRQGRYCISLEINENPWTCPELSLSFKWTFMINISHGTNAANTAELAWFGSCVRVINAQDLFCRGASGLQSIETILAENLPSGITLTFSNINSV